jgi:hypothetical protein
MYSQLLNSITSKIMDVWLQTMMSPDWDNKFVYGAFPLYLQVGSGRKRNEQGNLISGGVHLDFFEERYKVSKYLAGDTLTYVDYALYAFYNVFVFSIYPRSYFGQSYPNTVRAFTDMMSVPKTQAVTSAYSWKSFAADGMFPPVYGMQYNQGFINNYINFWLRGSQVVVLFAEPGMCKGPLGILSDDVCIKKSIVAKEAFDLMKTEFKEVRPNAKFIEADLLSCRKYSEPTIRVYYNSSEWTVPLTVDTKALLDFDSWKKSAYESPQ